MNTISIYPNPSTGIYTVYSNTTSLDKIEVYDIMGKIIETKSNIQINGNSSTLNLSHISSGIYFVKITSNNQSTVKRIIKK